MPSCNGSTFLTLYVTFQKYVSFFWKRFWGNVTNSYLIFWCDDDNTSCALNTYTNTHMHTQIYKDAHNTHKHKHRVYIPNIKPAVETRGVFSRRALKNIGRREGEEGEGPLHYPEIIGKFTEQAFYPIGSRRCVMPRGHSVDTGSNLNQHIVNWNCSHWKLLLSNKWKTCSCGGVRRRNGKLDASDGFHTQHPAIDFLTSRLPEQ